MKYLRSQMLYDDGEYYNWSAPEGHDNPKVIGGKEKDELNRTEGYEVLPFINNYINSQFENPDVSDYQKMEKIIRYDVPKDIHNRFNIRIWILVNWSRCSNP